MTSSTEFLRVIFALLFVLGLLYLLNVLVRKYGTRIGLRGMMTTGKSRRLDLVEIMPLDARYKVALIQRDDVQHLILLGGTDAQVIETGIAPASQDNSTAAPTLSKV